MVKRILVILCIVLLCHQCLVDSHGRLIQPPGRSTAWRYGFTTPHNYNDHELYCGGYSTQWGKNNGNCGICGDPYHMPRPRANENTGIYGQGVIVQKYKRGQKIEIGIELTANHRGFFEFRLCAHNAPKLPEKEDCFKYLLKRANSDGHRFFPGIESRKYFPTFRLPKRLTCTQCVLQWRYVAGNNWGKCTNGSGMVGCGPQEEFRSCADITITDEDGSADDTPSRIPDIPDDEVDYNVIEVDSRKQNQTLIHHSRPGRAVALSLAFLFVFLLFLSLLSYYMWKKGTVKKFYKKSIKPKWASKVLQPLTMPSLKKKKSTQPPGAIKTYGVQSLQLATAPVVPPRRNRPSSKGVVTNSVSSGARAAKVTPIRRPILTISSPTRVSINGVQITPNSSPIHPELRVPEKDNYQR